MECIEEMHQFGSLWTACLPAGVINARKAHNNANQPTQEAGEELRLLMFAPNCLVAIVSSQIAAVINRLKPSHDEADQTTWQP